MALDRRRHRPFHVHECEEMRIGIEIADLLEHPLAAAHTGEPVVHERYALGRWGMGGGGWVGVLHGVTSREKPTAHCPPPTATVIRAAPHRRFHARAGPTDPTRSA